MRASMLAPLGLTALAAGFLLNLILPDAAAFAWILLALGAALVAVAFLLDYRRVRGALASSRGRFGMGATVRACLFVGIAILANAVSFSAYHRFDFTGLAQFTLTSQTKAVLQALDEPVEIVSFFTPGATAPVENYAESLLAEYRNHSDRITLRRVDPDLNPDQAREYGVEQMGALLGVLVFTGESGRKRVFGPEVTAGAEHAFTGAILEVTGTKQKQVLFLTGHGEHRIDADYASARQGLRDNLFQVGELDLLVTPEVPDEAAAVIVAGPRQPLGAGEMEAIRRYLENAGRLLLLLDPNPSGDLRALLSEWWLGIEDGFVVDPASHVAPATSNLLVDRARNTFGLPQANFPGAAAIRPEPGMPDSLELTPLAGTSPDSWLEKAPASAMSPVFDTQTDRKGPLALGALISVRPGQATDGGGGARLAVVGDSDFAANGHFASGNNSDLFLTTVNWLAADASVISVDRKALTVRRLVLTPEQARFLHVASIGFMPLILFVAGGVIWWRRR